MTTFSQTIDNLQAIVRDAINLSIKYQNTTHIKIEHDDMTHVITAFGLVADDSDYATWGEKVADFYGTMENGDEYRVGVRLVTR